MPKERLNKKLAMLNGEFKPAHARKLVSNLYGEAINQYKIDRLKKWVNNHHADTSEIDHLINELMGQQSELNQVIDEAEKNNRLVAFKGNFTAKLVA